MLQKIRVLSAVSFYNGKNWGKRILLGIAYAVVELHRKIMLKVLYWGIVFFFIHAPVIFEMSWISSVLLKIYWCQRTYAGLYILVSEECNGICIFCASDINTSVHSYGIYCRIYVNVQFSCIIVTKYLTFILALFVVGFQCME